MKRTIVVVYPNGDIRSIAGPTWQVNYFFCYGVLDDFGKQCDRLRAERPGVRIWEEFS